MENAKIANKFKIIMFLKNIILYRHFSKFHAHFDKNDLEADIREEHQSGKNFNLTVFTTSELEKESLILRLSMNKSKFTKYDFP